MPANNNNWADRDIWPQKPRLIIDMAQTIVYLWAEALGKVVSWCCFHSHPKKKKTLKNTKSSRLYTNYLPIAGTQNCDAWRIHNEPLTYFLVKRTVNTFSILASKIGSSKILASHFNFPTKYRNSTSAGRNCNLYLVKYTQKKELDCGAEFCIW